MSYAGHKLLVEEAMDNLITKFDNYVAEKIEDYGDENDDMHEDAFILLTRVDFEPELGEEGTVMDGQIILGSYQKVVEALVGAMKERESFRQVVLSAAAHFNLECVAVEIEASLKKTK